MTAQESWDDRDFRGALEKAQEKILVFTVTAGRTGTRYLAELFRTLNGVQAVHEDDPSFADLMRPAQRHPDIARAWVAQCLIPRIARDPKPAYVRTDHLAGQGYLDPILVFGLRPGVILLGRQPRRIALSYLERDTVPGRTALGIRFCLDPTDPDVLPLPALETLGDYQLCFWFALEMERRQHHYGALFRKLGLPVESVTAEQLNDPRRWLACLRTLRLDPFRDGFAGAIRHAKVSVGAWNKNPKKLTDQIDFDREEEEVWARIAPHAPDLRAMVEARYDTSAAGAVGKLLTELRRLQS